MSAEPLLVTREEAAHALRCSPAVIDRLEASGRIPAIRFADDERGRFRPEDLVELVEQAGRLAVADGLEERAAALARQRSSLAEQRQLAKGQLPAAARAGGTAYATVDGQLRDLSRENERVAIDDDRARVAALVLRIDPLVAGLRAAHAAAESEALRLGEVNPARLGALAGVFDLLSALARVSAAAGAWPAAVAAAEREAAG